jgi:hypothetical protein
MSYLNTPRLVFAGRFLAAPSTVNNDPEHFDTAAFQSNYQLPGTPTSPNGWWNPGGDAAWQFVGCVVKAVYYRDGTSCDDPAVDPIVGALINDLSLNIAGKIVDLDPEQQNVSEIWGFRVELGKQGSDMGFSGNFTVAPFADLWFSRCPSASQDTAASAFFQSVLEPIQWNGAGSSRFLKELSGSGTPSTLSIRFNVDGYQGVPSLMGRLVGSIGPYKDGEARRFVASRALAPASSSNFPAYAQVDSDVLSIDLGNSLQIKSPGGPFLQQGPMTVALLPPGRDPIELGTVDPKDPWFEKTAGIASFRLTADAQNLAASTPIGVTIPGASGQVAQTILSEPDDGAWVRADDYVFRLNPGYRAKSKFYARAFGQPIDQAIINLGFNASNMAMQTDQGPIPGPSIVGEPERALVFPKLIVTGRDGTAELTLQAGDPGLPRSYIDGQLYGISYALDPASPPANAIQNASTILTALVWSLYEPPARPTWLDDVLPIFQQYANLYPVMKQYVDLSSYDDVVAKRALIKQVFNLPITSARYMPVTRDLSDAKRLMILRWLDNPLYEHPESPLDQ